MANRLSDLHEVSAIRIDSKAWENVGLVTATSNDKRSVPWILILDDAGEILYHTTFPNDMYYWDVFVDDLDQDGWPDIWTVLCLRGVSPERGYLVNIFYQTDGGIRECEREEQWGRKYNHLLKEYFGEYQVTRFCPTEGYDDISEAVMTKREAEEMLQKRFVIKDDLFVAYDSQRRMGTRQDRKPPAKDNMITEYHDTGAWYVWQPALPETLLHKTCPDEKLRKAIGEENYGKINGVFYDAYAGWQQFYMLEGEEKLIMHSMLTGQNFILEKTADGFGREEA